MIKIKLTGEFSKLAPVGNDKGLFAIEYEEGLSLGALLQRLGVAAAGVNYTALVNNSRKTPDYLMQDGDSIIVMPLLAGG
jgi:molybdopterin converting factor small subunit